MALEDERILDLLFARSEDGIREMEEKYGVRCRKLARNILGMRRNV